MADKRITTELVVKAVDQYSGMIRNMSGVTGRFATKVRSDMGRLQGLRGPLRMIEDYKAAQSTFDRSAVALRRSRERVAELRREMRTTSNPTKKMTQEFERAKRAAERLRLAHEKNGTELTGLQGKLRSAGVNTGDLAGEQRRLTNALGAANANFARQAERMQRLGVMQDRITAGRDRMDRALARSANLNFVGNASMQTGRRILTGMSAPIMRAVAFESAMSDVRKVVDFESPAAFRTMSEDILEMSTRIPIAATGLAEIVAAGGQSGIAQEELARFAQMAAKAGVAFDMSAGSIGTSMAEIKTAFRIDLDQTSSLFDAMNHLSNNSAARAHATLEFMNRAGADGENYGYDHTETLAIGAAMIAAGAGADTAATSFRNMGRALTRGEGATDRQSAAMQRLGLDSEAVARAMQQDAVGTTMDVMRRLNALPDHLRASVMSDLFGDEARELTKLMNNMQLMPEMLALVADETQYLGSAEAEYAERSRTTANNMQLLRNQTARLGISIGEVVLPPLNELLSKSQVFIDKLVTWTKENPKLTKTLVMGGVALGAMAVAGGFLLNAAAGLIGTMAVLRFGLVSLGARAVFAGGGLASLAGRFAVLRRLPRFALSTLITPLRWVAGLIPSIRWRALAGGLKWSSLIRPLTWLARGALRFIHPIGWAVLAGELAWRLLIKPLGWDEYLSLEALGGYLETVKSWFTWDNLANVIDWAVYLPFAPLDGLLNLLFGFDWAEKLPDWSWDFIPDLDLGSKIKGFGSAWANSIEDGSILGTSVAPANVGLNTYIPPSSRMPDYMPGMPVSFRASGGPFGKNPLVVGERGPEMYFPNRSGFIATAMQTERLQRGAQRVRSLGLSGLTAAAVATNPIAAVAPDRPQPGGGGPSSRVEINGGIHIVAPSGVSDPEGLVDLIETRLDERISATFAASFSD